MATRGWQVRLTKTPIVNDFRSDYFPRKFGYKKDAMELLDEVRGKGGDGVVEPQPSKSVPVVTVEENAKHKRVDRAMSRLKELLQDGDRVYGLKRHINDNSDTHYVALFIATERGMIHDITQDAAIVCERRLSRLGIRVDGTGFNKVADVVEDLGSVIVRALRHDHMTTIYEPGD